VAAECDDFLWVTDKVENSTWV